LSLFNKDSMEGDKKVFVMRTVCVCVCVCVRERERERGERARKEYNTIENVCYKNKRCIVSMPERYNKLC
jgi:hypothetical protein